MAVYHCKLYIDGYCVYDYVRSESFNRVLTYLITYYGESAIKSIDRLSGAPHRVRDFATV